MLRVASTPMPAGTPAPDGQLHGPAALQPHAPAGSAPGRTADPLPEQDEVVIEHLRVRVASGGLEAWLAAERTSWEPWLQQQPGFLGRELLWDPEREEGVLLIRWASRGHWKAIPAAVVEQVQADFERQARLLLREAFSQWGENEPAGATNPFPLLFSGEADVQLWAASASAPLHEDGPRPGAA